jgi:two-component system, sensor histidine kinase and response regulator
MRRGPRSRARLLLWLHVPALVALAALDAGGAGTFGIALVAVSLAALATAGLARGEDPGERAEPAAPAAPPAGPDETRRLRDELLAVASNELRNPLTTILGFSEVLLDDDGQLSEAQRLNFVTKIATQARRLERLMTGIFDASEAEPGEASHTHVSRTVRLVLADVVEESEQHRIRVGQVAPGLCAGIPYRAWRLILGNLVDNALRFARPDSAVSLDVVLSHDAGEWVELTCTVERDPAILTDPRRLFEPLIQADPDDTRAAAWLGLGLHLVAQAVISHGGQVVVGGTGETVTFMIRLPAAEHEPQTDLASA